MPRHSFPKFLSLAIFIIISFAGSALALDAPRLFLSTAGTGINLFWTPSPGATGYALYYAGYPDAPAVYRADLGNTSTFSASLPFGSAFYVAIKAYDNISESDFSNIEHFIIQADCDYSLQTPEYSEACHACLDMNGTVLSGLNSDNETVTVCRYSTLQEFDDGYQEMHYTCDINYFAHGECADGSGSDIHGVSSAVKTLCPDCEKTVRQRLDDQVHDILLKIKNTGYSHRPFNLVTPPFTDLKKQTQEDPIEEYDLFLDCSGFVGWYVLQGIAPKLYNDLPRDFSCGPLSHEEGIDDGRIARPLAIDFADMFKSADLFDGIEATDPENACWSRVAHISDARPGDILVYAHEDNVNRDTQYCCHRVGDKYKATEMDSGSSCDDGRITYKAKKDGDHRKNTGHVLYVTGYPYRSSKKMGTDHKRQWIVYVADSTTGPHMFDGRRINRDGHDRSHFGPNTYHAWTKGDGTVWRCKDDSGDIEYHRDCSYHGMEDDASTTISTIKSHATGIGTGRIYINDDMHGYRVNFSHDTARANIYIGRPVPCE